MLVIKHPFLPHEKTCIKTGIFRAVFLGFECWHDTQWLPPQSRWRGRIGQWQQKSWGADGIGGLVRYGQPLSEILNYMGYTNRTKFRNKYVKPLLHEGQLLMTDLAHPTSKFQKYVAKAWAILENAYLGPEIHLSPTFISGPRWFQRPSW